MKILLLGCKGFLGSYLHQKLKDVYIDYDPSVQYSHVINCIGKTIISYCQLHPEESKESNVNVIKKICKDFPKSKIISFSTYYVYDDYPLCDENSNTTDAYYYMEHKIEHESIVLENGGVCFRLGKLFGHSDISAQKKLTHLMMTSNEVTVDNVRFNPTSLTQVLNAILFEIDNSCFQGIFNLSNEGTATHYEYARRIRDRKKLKISIKNVDKIKRDFHNYGRFAMDTKLITEYIKLNRWQDDLDIYIDSIGR